MSNLYVNPADGNSYAGIIDAINAVNVANQKEKKEYPPNYKGIIQALFELGRITDVPADEFPPGWNPIYDEDGNLVDGDWTQLPRDGQLWFDPRQGRLFIWATDAFYQCNGADGLTIVGDTAPTREVIGGLWYNTLNLNLYIYDGTTWSIVGGAAAVSTATLPLSNPTTDTFANNRPFLPPTAGLVTQEHYNTWVYSALEELENEIDAIPAPEKLGMGVDAPQTAEEGDFWYSTSKLQLYVWYDGAWVPASTPLRQDTEFVQLEAAVTAQALTESTRHDLLLAKIAELNAKPHHTYTAVDNNSLHIPHGAKPGVYLVDETMAYTGVTFAGTNGIDVTVDSDGLVIDSGALDSRVSAIELEYVDTAQLDAVKADVTALETSVNGLSYATPADVQAVSTALNALPTHADLTDKVNASAPSITGDLNANGNTIYNLPAAVEATEPVRKHEFDAYQQLADVTYFRKTDGILRNVKFQNLQADQPSLDFSTAATDSERVLKLKNNTDGQFTTFGANQNPYEYAWQFNSNEDFCWVGAAGKVASITKDGLTANKLTIGHFEPNNSNGQVVTNKIDVGESLAAHKAALAGIKSALQTSDTFADFKVAALAALQGI